MAGPESKDSYPDGNKYPVTEAPSMRDSSVPNPKKPQGQPTK